MNKWSRLVLLIGMLLPFSVLSKESPTGFLCISDHATGFSLNSETRQWEVAEFERAQFIVRRRSTENLKELKEKMPTLNWDALSRSEWVWEVELFGEIVIAYCKREIDHSGYLDCEGLDTKFRMNTQRGRFIVVDYGGYAESETSLSSLGMAEGEHKPFMIIGRCSRI